MNLALTVGVPVTYTCSVTNEHHHDSTMHRKAAYIWTQPSLRLPAVGHQTQHLGITFLLPASSRPLDTTFFRLPAVGR